MSQEPLGPFADKAISYGEALARSLWEYLRLSDYLRVVLKSRLSGQTEFEQVEEYWKRVLGSAYLRENRRPAEPLASKSVVKLVNFTITEWFPWLPGRYWTPWGNLLRHMSRNYVMRVVPKQLARYLPSRILRPDGKTLTVLSGVGSVRMREHGSGRTKFKVVGATTRRDASSAIPVVMSDKAYGRIRDRVEEHGSVTATFSGIYDELPVSLDYLVLSTMGVPRSCIYVGSKYLIKDVQEGYDVDAAGWTLYDRKRPNGIEFAYSYFSVQDTEGPTKAAEFLSDYVDHYGRTPLTDFDEKTQRLEATIPITKVVTGAIEVEKIRAVIQRIRKLYPEVFRQF